MVDDIEECIILHFNSPYSPGTQHRVVYKAVSLGKLRQRVCSFIKLAGQVISSLWIA